MKNKFIYFLALILLITFISSPISALGNEYEDVESIGTLDESINQDEQDNLPEYVPAKPTQHYENRNAIVRFIIKNGMKAYKSIKYAPKYPKGFKAAQNGTKHVTVNNKPLLKDLRKIESGKWVKVFKNGYVKGKKVSVHYFQSRSGYVFDVKTKDKWSKF
ncbi:hypothetical protein [Staphylococcus arlettae]|uniref:hypothetical protein n=1 Tax=Staphylococcus arlettae TaxID=29378 RepID=UPI001E57D305|nr:hypothetical protein [Staphylococcus arlettae]MCD8849035.1 hypothetical protein [Staphylococcus arlettae]